MIVLFIILLCISIYGAKFASYNEGYISRDTSNAVKGALAVTILFSHLNTYINLPSNLFNNTFCITLRFLGQLMVAPYLFYSGFGIMEKLKKNTNYYKAFPKKRILKTLFHFDIAVLIYLVASFITNAHFRMNQYLLCWIGWESIEGGSSGNTNWFVFVIILLYIITYICTLLSNQREHNSREKHIVIASTVSTISIIVWFILRRSGKEYWWYDTLITFPFGMWFSIYKEKFESLVMERFSSWISIPSIVAIFGAWRVLIGNDSYGICACLFCLAITAILTKVHIGNKALQWLGAHAFAIYIMQRLPMNVFEHLGLNSNPYLFACATIPTVLVIAFMYNKLVSYIDTSFHI